MVMKRDVMEQLARFIADAGPRNITAQIVDSARHRVAQQPLFTPGQVADKLLVTAGLVGRVVIGQ